MPAPPASRHTPACVVLIDTVADRLIAQQLTRHYALPDSVELIDVRSIAQRGAAVIEALRATRFTGGILIISRSPTEDRVDLLDAGADHVLDSSRGVDELVAWVRSNLRRTQWDRRTPLLPEHLDPELTLCTRTNAIVNDELRTDITETERRILTVLLRNRGDIVHRRHLLMVVWGVTCESTTNVLNAYIWSIRRKLAAVGAPSILRTIRGKGFVLLT
ncbi:winged-helix domain-containing protein [Rhodococcus sp. NPDC056960]|uniref:winged helix-turn-helix transcriptional regulator n=1 Tax=Rhodococcus sp. NPDC056960 TaxID=3345982 RepID=UPI0036389CD7